MNTITKIRDLDSYLVLFFDRSTIYNYSIVSKETNQIISNHKLFKLLKRYHVKNPTQRSILTWAILNNEPLILDWHMNIDYKFENIFLFVDLAIYHSRIKILDWFYQKGIFCYTLVALHSAVLDESFDIIDWFYDHHLAEQYLDGSVSKPEHITDNMYCHEKILRKIKWFWKKNHPVRFEFEKMTSMISKGSKELIEWLLEHKLIDKSIFTDKQFKLSLNIVNFHVEKQIEILEMLKELGYHFDGIEESLSYHPMEILAWCIKNIPSIRLSHIFKFAALMDKISIMEWTGIDKNHPEFSNIDHNHILEASIKHRYMNTIIWYSKNIIFDDQFLTKLLIIIAVMHGLTIDIVMLLEQRIGKNNQLSKPDYRNIIRAALTDGNISMLKYALTKILVGSVAHICISDLSYCIKSGHIHILEWLKPYIRSNIINTGPPLTKIYIDWNDIGLGNAIDEAASKGYLEILKWLKNFFQHQFKYDKAIDRAALHMHIDILDWFDKTFEDILQFKYSDIAIDHQPYDNRTEILEWFHRSRHQFKYSDSIINDSICYAHFHVLEWFKRNKYPMVFTLRSIYFAFRAYNCESLRWLRDNGIIKILDKEIKDANLIFKIELAQPFADFRRDNIQYDMINGNCVPKDEYVNIGFDEVNIECINDESVINGQTINKHKMIAITFYHKNLMRRLFNKTDIYYDHINIYHNLCWFENWYKQQFTSVPH